MESRPLVAVIHATPATLAPVGSAFAGRFPRADLWHLLDDRLVTDAERAGGLTEPLHRRMATLIDYAVQGGADAVQLACSMYGPVASAVDHAVPVLSSDRAMFAEVLRLRPGRVTVLASLAAAAKDTTERLGAFLDRAGLTAQVDAVVVEQAKQASAEGDLEQLARVLARAARRGGDSDVIVLAQYSLTPVVDEVDAAIETPVLSGPHLAAAALASLVEDDSR